LYVPLAEVQLAAEEERVQHRAVKKEEAAAARSGPVELLYATALPGLKLYTVRVGYR
jgi:hypothetical protein